MRTAFFMALTMLTIAMHTNCIDNMMFTMMHAGKLYKILGLGIAASAADAISYGRKKDDRSTLLDLQVFSLICSGCAVYLSRNSIEKFEDVRNFASITCCATTTYGRLLLLAYSEASRDADAATSTPWLSSTITPILCASFMAVLLNETIISRKHVDMAHVLFATGLFGRTSMQCYWAIFGDVFPPDLRFLPRFVTTTIRTLNIVSLCGIAGMGAKALYRHYNPTSIS